MISSTVVNILYRSDDILPQYGKFSTVLLISSQFTEHPSQYCKDDPKMIKLKLEKLFVSIRGEQLDY